MSNTCTCQLSSQHHFDIRTSPHPQRALLGGLSPNKHKGSLPLHHTLSPAQQGCHASRPTKPNKTTKVRSSPILSIPPPSNTHTETHSPLHHTLSPNIPISITPSSIHPSILHHACMHAFFHSFPPLTHPCSNQDQSLPQQLHSQTTPLSLPYAGLSPLQETSSQSTLMTRQPPWSPPRGPRT